MTYDNLNEDQIQNLREKLVHFSMKLMDIPYEFGAEWKNFLEIPSALDCSEMIEGIYNHFGLKMPDGSQNQFNFTVSTSNPKMADLAFFGRSGDVSKIYHVGMVFDNENIIEARGYDPNASFPTGKVIIRPRLAWERYKNFVGYRSHPKLV